MKRSLLSPMYSVWSPCGVHAESEDSPRTKFRLFLAEPPANFENPSPNLVLGQSEDSPRTARTLGLSSDGVRGLISDSPRTV